MTSRMIASGRHSRTKGQARLAVARGADLEAVLPEAELEQLAQVPLVIDDSDPGRRRCGRHSWLFSRFHRQFLSPGPERRRIRAQVRS